MNITTAMNFSSSTSLYTQRVTEGQKEGECMVMGLTKCGGHGCSLNFKQSEKIRQETIENSKFSKYCNACNDSIEYPLSFSRICVCV